MGRTWTEYIPTEGKVDDERELRKNWFETTDRWVWKSYEMTSRQRDDVITQREHKREMWHKTPDNTSSLEAVSLFSSAENKSDSNQLHPFNFITVDAALLNNALFSFRLFHLDSVKNCVKFNIYMTVSKHCYKCKYISPIEGCFLQPLVSLTLQTCFLPLHHLQTSFTSFVSNKIVQRSRPPGLKHDLNIL